MGLVQSQVTPPIVLNLAPPPSMPLAGTRNPPNLTCSIGIVPGVKGEHSTRPGLWYRQRIHMYPDRVPHSAQADPVTFIPMKQAYD